MSYLADIEDFTTDQLRAEIIRRETADREGKCWYCSQNVAAHTCKYAVPSPCPGWIVDPPRFVTGESCMGDPEQYWQAGARNPVTGRHRMANADTAAEATAKLIAQLQAG